MQKEEFKINNGKFDIYGMKYIPDTPKNIPILVSHGFMSNYKLIENYSNFFCEMGYTVYAFDFAGGHFRGKSEGDRGYMTLEHELLDMECVMNIIKENKKELMLFGESMGGFLSLLYASRNPESVKRVLCVYPALCIPDDARRGKMLMMRFDPKNIRATFKTKFGLKFSPEFAEEAVLMDTDKILKNVMCPVCIVAGGKDKIVSPTYGRKALELLSKDSFVYFIKKAGHGFTNKQRKECFAHFSEFLK